ncbi:hypothetical protein GQX74_001225 [Glossina fuscipes]|nr:hypothetical protein GQX74_001225 [Glossina fuscipes]
MLKILLSAFTCLALFGSTAFAASSCSSSNGTYPVSGSCDGYIECRNGVAEEKLCPDGLLYNEKSTGYPCGYPIDVDCQQGQGRIQPAQPTEECPHQFGYFPLGDSKNCGQFKNCADGRGYVFDCPDDLAWNKNTYKCDWPDMVEDCDAAAFLGFKCPGPASSSAKSKSPLLGEPAAEYHFYPDPQSCQHYFICLEGRPRRIGCGEDRAFNQELNECDDIENVPNCILGYDCPEPNGRFAAPEQCDAYVECHDKIGEEKLCPDGLLFHQRTHTTGDCTYAPLSVCKERTRLQPANGTDECPRQFGFYSLGDPANCGVYHNCAHGIATLTKCPEGLAFNIDTYQCDWPDTVKECNAEAFLGFTCPAVSRTEDIDDNEEEMRFYPHPDNCKRYFVCVNDRPRLYSCGRNLAFNPDTKLCDFYTNIPGCSAGFKFNRN